jgi:predicted phosphate transport protein (TIGR00153 family)
LYPGLRSSHSADQETSVRWFQALLPREDSFFDRFVDHARLLLQGAEALRELLAGGEGVADACAAIMRHEQAADEVAREVFLAVRRTFITPFDRSDIRGLTSSLDDAIDQMQKTAKSITLFEVREFQPEMRELGDLAIQAAYLTLEATELLRDLGRNAPRLNAIAEAVTRIEGRSDEVYDLGMKSLFRASQDHPMDFIVGADIYDHLEKVIDRFEDVANHITGILIERL